MVGMKNFLVLLLASCLVVLEGTAASGGALSFGARGAGSSGVTAMGGASACEARWIWGAPKDQNPALVSLLRLRGAGGELEARLETLISSAPVMLFMKGSAEEPKCGFSRTIIGILHEAGISFSTFDVLGDEEVRQGLKAYSNWPTYPQLYAQGKLIGGLDVIKELVEAGELESELGVEREPSDKTKVLTTKIAKALAAERVEVADLSDGCGSKFSVFVVSEKFEGMRESLQSPPPLPQEHTHHNGFLSCFRAPRHPRAHPHAPDRLDSPLAALIERQRAVHEAIKEEMPSIHALTLKCKTPAQDAAAAADGGDAA